MLHQLYAIFSLFAFLCAEGLVGFQSFFRLKKQNNELKDAEMLCRAEGSCRVK